MLLLIMSIKNNLCCGGGGPSGAIYGLGFIGALIYFLQHTVGFWAVVLGILKAVVWPAFAVFKLLEFLKI